MTQLKRIHSQAQSLARQLLLGRSYFGQVWNYAPRTSYKALSKNRDTLSLHLKDLEETSLKYFDEMRSTQKAQRRLTTAIQQADNVSSSLNRAVDALHEQESALLKDIRAADALVAEEQSSFIHAIAELDVALRQKELLGAGDIAQAVGKMSVPSGPTDVSAIASIVKATGGLVKDQIDAVHQIEFAINRIEMLGDRISSLADVHNLSKDSPEGYLVVASQQRFKEALKPYSDVLAANNLSDALERFIVVCMARNNLIVERSGILARVADLNEQIEQNQQQQKEARRALAEGSRPDLPEFSSFVDRLYLDMQDQFIEQLYNAGRAYSFWSLQDYDLFRGLPGMDQPSTLNRTVLDGESVRILSAYMQAMEERGAQPQHFPPPDQSDTPGVIYRIDEESFPGAISQLREHGETMVRLVAPDNDTKIDENPFAGKALVRITKVRAWLSGATAENSHFVVRLVHGGSHELVNTDGSRTVLASRSVMRDFDYKIVEVNEKRTPVIQLDGDIGEPDKSKREYALVSPFTTWRIIISERLNQSLDRSELDAVDLEFYGQCFPI